MSEDKQSRIEAIFQSYSESLPPLMVDLASLWGKLGAQWDIELAIEFDRKVHNLAGSAATFELEKIGDAARDLEHSFKPLVHAEYDLVNPRWSESTQLLAQLKMAVESSANE